MNFFSTMPNVFPNKKYKEVTPTFGHGDKKPKKRAKLSLAQS